MFYLLYYKDIIYLSSPKHRRLSTYMLAMIRLTVGHSQSLHCFIIFPLEEELGIVGTKP